MSLRNRRVLETEPNPGPVSATTLAAPARPRSAAHVTWIVGEPAERTAAHKRPIFPRSALPADAAFVLQKAAPGDTVMISALEIAPLVEMCDRLLNRGVAVALEIDSFPALTGLMRRRDHRTGWVRLEPADSHQLPRLTSRVVDAAAGIAATIVFGPLLTVLMLIVRATSVGPAIYRSPRVGRDGVAFDLYKLRTMRRSNRPEQEVRKELYRDFMNVRGASESRGLKVVDESRVTPIGRFLRKHSLDELPQFWNIVRGDLSLVGPRPCMPYEWELHEGWHRLRFRSRPGLTGLWQAYGRGRVTFEEMVLMDYCYSWRKSLLVDLRIIVRTGVVVITGEGGG